MNVKLEEEVPAEGEAVRWEMDGLSLLSVKRNQ